MTPPRRSHGTAPPIVNLEQATFDCTFGRGCEGICCRNGHPPLSDNDIWRILSVWSRVLAKLRPKARLAVLRRGFMTSRLKGGRPMPRGSEGWCVFFNRGCVLHALGAEDGDWSLFKPTTCALFPIDQDRTGRWRVRQRGTPAERWDLACLDPAASQKPASTTLREELSVFRRIFTAR